MSKTLWRRLQDWWRRKKMRRDQSESAKKSTRNVSSQNDDQMSGGTADQSDGDRYVVLDENDQQIEAFADLQRAEHVWRDDTKERGSIVDTQTKEDVTPNKVRKGQLTQDQLAEVQGLMAGSGPPSPYSLSIDYDQLAAMRTKINRKPVPVFDLTNINGRGKQRPTRTVQVTRRNVVIERVRKVVEVEELGPPQPDGLREVAYPTEHSELHPMRSVGDLRRVPRRQLALPPDVLRQRVAGKQLMRQVFEEEIPGSPVVKKRKVWQEVDEPRVHEWTEDVEVLEEPQAQLLEIVLDVSGSMQGDNIHLAVALASAVVGSHLDDGSQYFYRCFASDVSEAVRAWKSAEKRELLKRMMNTSHELGGGTNIIQAVGMAAEDVRAVAKKCDQPEVLLITDGRDYTTAEEVYAVIGQDVMLHTVIVGSWPNVSLKQHSSTYYRLFLTDGRVVGTKDDIALPTPERQDLDDLSDGELLRMLRDQRWYS